MRAAGVALVVLLGATAACQGESRVFPEQLHAVPSVVGEGVPDARDALVAEGFGVALARVGTERTFPDDGSCDDSIVTDQLPAPDSEVLTGSTVTLFVADCAALSEAGG